MRVWIRGVHLCVDKKRKKPYKVNLLPKDRFFKTAIEAAKAYDKIALEKYGKDAVTNKMMGLV